MINIRDPLYGDIRLTDEESNLLNTYEMQRLTRVKQLGLKYLVYPGATHTRFEHSLGVRHLAELVLHRSELFDTFSKEERRIFYLAALLHDVSHPCFSHELEGLSHFPSHEVVREYMLKGEVRDRLIDMGIFTEAEIRRDKIRFIGDVLNDSTVAALLEFFNDKDLISHNLLDHRIDVDNLDYLKRDPYYLGLSSANYDQRIYSAFRITEDTDGNRVLSFSDDDTSVEAIMSVLHARYYLYKIAYQHHTVLIADSMLYEAVNAFHTGSRTIDLTFLTGDNEYLEYLRKGLTMGEDEYPSRPTVRSNINRLLTRNLYKKAFVLDNSDFYARRKVEQMRDSIELRQNFIDSLEEEEGVKLIFSAKESNWKPFGKIRIGVKNPVPLKVERGSELEVLKDNYEDLWKFIVATGKSDFVTRKRVYDICKDFFRTKGKYLPEPRNEVIEGEQPEIKSVLNRIRREKAAALRVLREIAGEKPVSSEEIAERVGISRSTVSQYINYLIRLFDSYGKNEMNISADKKGRRKTWWIKDEKYRVIIKD